MSYSYSNPAAPVRSSSSSPPPPLYTGGRSSSSTPSSSSSSSSPSSRRYVEVSGVEMGVIQSVKESYFFILCAEREGELFAHASDVTSDLPPSGLRKGDEVQFVVCSDPTQPAKLFAKRVALLPPAPSTSRSSRRTTCRASSMPNSRTSNEHAPAPLDLALPPRRRRPRGEGRGTVVASAVPPPPAPSR